MGIGRIENVQTDYPAIGWGNGLMKARSSEKARFQEFVGFFVTAGEDHQLDEAMKTAGYSQIEAQHPRQGSDPIIKKHWSLGESLEFLPVTQGTPATNTAALLRMNGKAAQSGVGIRWPQGERAQVGVIGYIKQLAEVGYMQPFRLGARSLMVDYLLKALADHTRICQYADSIVDRSKHPDPVELYEIVWKIGAGEQVAFGKTSTSLVYPIVSQHPASPDAAYIKANYVRSDEIKQKAEADFPAIQQWASGFASSGDAQGDESHANGTGNASATGSTGSNGNGAQKATQQASGEGFIKREEQRLACILVLRDNSARNNGNATWMGLDLLLINHETMEGQEEIKASIFFKGVVAKAITELQEGDLRWFTGYQDEEGKFVVTKWGDPINPVAAGSDAGVDEEGDEIPF